MEVSIAALLFVETVELQSALSLRTAINDCKCDTHFLCDLRSTQKAGLTWH